MVHAHITTIFIIVLSHWKNCLCDCATCAEGDGWGGAPLEIRTQPAQVSMIILVHNPTYYSPLCFRPLPQAHVARQSSNFIHPSIHPAIHPSSHSSIHSLDRNRPAAGCLSYRSIESSYEGRSHGCQVKGKQMQGERASRKSELAEVGGPKTGGERES